MARRICLFPWSFTACLVFDSLPSQCSLSNQGSLSNGLAHLLFPWSFTACLVIGSLFCEDRLSSQGSLSSKFMQLGYERLAVLATLLVYSTHASLDNGCFQASERWLDKQRCQHCQALITDVQSFTSQSVVIEQESLTRRKLV